MIVSEVFGPTIQGEGPSAGRRSGFVRLGKCNLTCSWCDTPYTWDWKGVNGTAYSPTKELYDQEVGQIVQQLDAMDVPLVVVTGGEPLLQRKALTELVSAVTSKGKKVEIETNGTLSPWPELSENVDRFNVSLKLQNSNVDLKLRIVETAIQEFAALQSVFKFVVSDPADLHQVAELQNQFNLAANQIWIMPEGTNPEELLNSGGTLVNEVVRQGWNFTTRLHVLLWGDQRGV